MTFFFHWLFKGILLTRICLEHPPSLTSLSLFRVSLILHPIIRMSSQVMSKHNHLFLGLLIIGMPFIVLFIFILSLYSFTLLRCHPRFYLSLFICSFDCSSLDHNSWFYLCSFLVPLVTRHQVTILVLIQAYSFVPLISHHQDVILGST